MKILFILITLVLSSAQSYDKKFPVVERKKGKVATRVYNRTLVDFRTKDSFDGKYFKIVQGQSNQAIMFSDLNKDNLLMKKAATVYYHLTKARDFWVNEMKSKTAEDIKQMIIRIDIDSQYSNVGHFGHKNLKPEYNNALTIPSGETPALIPEKDSWGNEIWFRPMKKIKTADLDDDLGQNPLTGVLRDLEDPIYSFVERDLEKETLSALFYERYKGPYWETLAWTAGSYAVMKIAIESSKLMDSLFMEKWYYLDTALVPEVVYHEYTHAILSDYLKLSHSTGVVEGVADYFAAEIASTTRVYSKVSGASTSHEKNAKNKVLYRSYHEDNSLARADFALSVLWRVSKGFPVKGNQLIYEARKYLDTYDATIHDSLLRSILKACDAICENPLNDRNRLYTIFESKGL